MSELLRAVLDKSLIIVGLGLLVIGVIGGGLDVKQIKILKWGRVPPVRVSGGRQAGGCQPGLGW